MRPACSFPCPQQPTAGTYPERHEVSPRLQIGFGSLSLFVGKTVLEIWKSWRKELDGNFLRLQKVIFNFPISVTRTRQTWEFVSLGVGSVLANTAYNLWNFCVGSVIVRVGLEKCPLALNSQPLDKVYVPAHHRHNYRLFKSTDTTVVTMKNCALCFVHQIF